VIHTLPRIDYWFAVQMVLHAHAAELADHHAGGGQGRVGVARVALVGLELVGDDAVGAAACALVGHAVDERQTLGVAAVVEPDSTLEGTQMKRTIGTTLAVLCVVAVLAAEASACRLLRRRCCSRRTRCVVKTCAPAPSTCGPVQKVETSQASPSDKAPPAPEAEAPPVPEANLAR